MKKNKFLVINGPNINLLGKREPEVYGSLTLKEIEKYTQEKLKSYNLEIEWFQSNIEGEIVSKIQVASQGDFCALIINPAAYSHTSIAILDALKIIPFNIIEVHISNTHTREEFRQNKITASASKIVMEGLGKNAYFLAIYSQLIEKEKE